MGVASLVLQGVETNGDRVGMGIEPFQFGECPGDRPQVAQTRGRDFLHGHAADEITKRVVSMTITASEASEEVFLSELNRVMLRPNEDDYICVTRTEGDLVWRPETGEIRDGGF